MAYSLIWIVAVIIFLVAEAVTSVLVSIWFAGGAVAALICSLFSENLTLQIFIFLIISLLCIVFVRNAAMKYFKNSKAKTNLDRIIGQTAYITETVDNLKNTGAVTLSGVDWKVKSESGAIIEKGKPVEIVAIEGVKLIVKNKEEKSCQ